jgi:hypothetical protein
MNIWYGTNENAWLSNLAERRFKRGYEYVSVEHAYQSWKSGSFCPIVYSKPWEAGKKYVGNNGVYKADNWNIKLMERLILESFQQNPGLWGALCLIDEEFTHSQDRGIWKYEFPRILSVVRDLGYSVDRNAVRTAGKLARPGAS